MIIVGITGKKRSGKDTAAAALVEQRGFVRVGFADALKKMALAVDPVVYVGNNGGHARLHHIVECVGWERAKDEYPEVRRLLNKLGTNGVRDIIGADSWINAWQRQVNELPTVQRYEMRSRGRTLVTARPNVVVPDVRFLNEASSVLEYPSLVIRVVRPGLDTNDTARSETEMDEIDPDVAVINDGTAEQLQAKVLAIVDEWVRAST